MKLRYFVLDSAGQLRKASRAAVEGLWHGCHRSDALGCSPANELRLVSVVCDNNLLPRKVYLLRLPLTDGRFTAENYLTLQLYAMPDCVTAGEVIRHHGQGWPRDFLRQLAVLIDVPLARLHLPLRVGGPLITAAALRVSPRQALRYLR